MAILVVALLTATSVLAQTPAFDPAEHQAAVDQLIEAALADSFAYERLAYLADTFGPRLSGSDNLERAIDWILETMAADGLENVRGEPVMVPHWVRGEESLTVIEPRRQELAVLGLGGSVGTPAEGLTAPAFVVGSMQELRARADEAAGTIVVYNAPFTTYGETVQVRLYGAIEAAKAGAVASLVRSVGPRSLYTPHTGTMRYDDAVPRIPHAAITIEDALLMQRMQDRGQPIMLTLRMGAETLPDAQSRNVVAEIVGRERPDEVVVIGGHIDSWDVGQGAMDDGGGCIVAWEAVRLMHALGLRPRRTVRVVLWTNEENGLRGALAYRDQHADEMDDHVLAVESDAGVFAPQGFGFSGQLDAYALLTQVAELLEPIGADSVAQGGGGADVAPLRPYGVPVAGLVVDRSEYFDYHHTAADTMDKLDPAEVARCVAAMAVLAYVVAEMEPRLPRAYLQLDATR